MGASSSHNNDPTSKNSLFGVVTLTKNADMINIGILVAEMDLTEDQVSHFQAVDLVKIY